MKSQVLLVVGLLLLLSRGSVAASHESCQPSPGTRTSAKFWSIAGDEKWSTHAWVNSLDEGRALRSQSTAASTNIHTFMLLQEETLFLPILDHTGNPTLSLRPDWAAKLQNASVDIVDGIRQGIIQGVSVGTNLLWRNVSWPSLAVVAAAVRSAVTAALGGAPDSFLLHMAEPAALFLTNMNQCGRRVDFPHLPEEIDLLSLSAEPGSNRAAPEETDLKASELGFFRAMVHQHWFYSNILKPKLNHRQQFLFQADSLLALPSIPTESDAGAQIDSWEVFFAKFNQWIQEDRSDPALGLELELERSRIGGVLSIPAAFLTESTAGGKDLPSNPTCLTRFLEVLLDRRSENSEESSAR
jgi:hypothetical protein